MARRAWWAKTGERTHPQATAKPVIVTRELHLIDKATVLAACKARGIATSLPPTARRRAEKKIRLVDLASMAGIDGEYFQSRKEAARYVQLRLAEQAGVVRALSRQPRFVLHTVNPKGLKVAITDYHADFAYYENLEPAHAAVRLFGEAAGEQHVIEECKGYPSEDWILRRKWVEAEYGIRIRVT